jgi:acetylornithine deacetylase/succinyl-diaminopimelate desuccinylase-like protein
MSLPSIVERRKAKTLAELLDLLRIPSVSTDPARRGDVARCAEFVRERMEAAGLESRLIPTKGHPIVFGQRLKASGRPTVLVYGHYDVQPPDPLDLWRNPPFTPTLEGDYVVARGATDNKGQFFSLLQGVEASREERGELPINVKFLIEGEEEIGSPNLEPFIRAEKDLLACDAVVIADTAQFGPGRPAIAYGLKGLVYMEIRVQGPDKDLHSGSYGGAVANPANVLARLMTSCLGADGRVTIPGFYDDVRDLEPWERESFRGLGADEADFMRETGVRAPHGEPGYTTIERRAGRPTFDINGMISGFTGDGAKTVLPSVASAKFSMRLVPDQDPERIEALVTRYLEAQAPSSVSISVSSFHHCKPVVVSRDSVAVRAAVRAIERGFGATPVFVREGGSIPVVSTFREELGVDVLLTGIGLPDDGAHSPNERFHLPDFYRGQVMMAALLEEFGKT